jgi:hypothetical protein
MPKSEDAPTASGPGRFGVSLSVAFSGASVVALLLRAP